MAVMKCVCCKKVLERNAIDRTKRPCNHEGLIVCASCHSQLRYLEGKEYNGMVGSNHFRGDAFVHDTADIAPPGQGTTIGKGTRIWRFVCIREGVTIGDNCQIGHCCYIDKNVKIGSNVKIQNHVSVFTGVEIADDVFIGPNVSFTNVRNPRSTIPRMEQMQKTVIETGASIGAGAVLRCGITIGKYAMVGAGTIVTHDIKPNTLIYNSKGPEVTRLVCKCGSLEQPYELEGWMVCCPECHESFEIPLNSKEEEKM